MLFIYLEKLGSKFLSKELNIIQSKMLRHKWKKENDEAVHDWGHSLKSAPIHFWALDL